MVQKNQRTFKISLFRVTTVLYHLWKIRCWIARATSTQYLKTNRFATFPMHTNESFFILGKRILEGKLKARSVLLWNFNQVTEYTLLVVIGNINKFLIYYIKLLLDSCVSLKNIILCRFCIFKTIHQLPFNIVWTHLHSLFFIFFHSARPCSTHATTQNIFHLSFMPLLYTFYC